MERVMGLFHDMRRVDRVTAILQRAGAPFERTIVSAQMEGEDELSPEVPLVCSVLTAAQRVAGAVRSPGQYPADDISVESKPMDADPTGAANPATDGASMQADVPAPNTVRSEGATAPHTDAILKQGDFRSQLAERGLGGHQFENFIKHILSGHLLVVFSFADSAAADGAISLMERMGALRVERIPAGSSGADRPASGKQQAP